MSAGFDYFHFQGPMPSFQFRKMRLLAERPRYPLTDEGASVQSTLGRPPTPPTQGPPRDLGTPLTTAGGPPHGGAKMTGGRAPPQLCFSCLGSRRSPLDRYASALRTQGSRIGEGPVECRHSAALI